MYVRLLQDARTCINFCFRLFCARSEILAGSTGITEKHPDMFLKIRVDNSNWPASVQHPCSSEKFEKSSVNCVRRKVSLPIGGWFPGL